MEMVPKITTVDTAFGSQYCCRTANGTSRSGHERSVLVHFQGTSQPYAQSDGASHDEGINEDGGKPYRYYLRKGQAKTVKHDAGTQDLLGAELDARYPRFGQPVP